MLQPMRKAMLRVSFFAVAFSALLALGTQALAQVAKQDLPLFPRYADEGPYRISPPARSRLFTFKFSEVRDFDRLSPPF
jgi:hypothetical protein